MPLLGQMSDGPDEVVAKLLTDLGLVTDPAFWQTHTDADPGDSTHDWAVWVSDEPMNPDNVVTVYEVTPQLDAKLMPTGEQALHYGITIRVRAGGSTPKATARLKAETIRVTLDQSVLNTNVTLNGNNYLVVAAPRVHLVPVGWETTTGRRYLVNLNCLFSILPRPLGG